MPKIRRVRSMSKDRSRSSPYPCSSSSNNLRNPTEDSSEEEWEQARCLICMEHPHNAVLLKCSSHEKGCRPYMCNTSYRHSNCLDQFRKSSETAGEEETLREIPLGLITSPGQGRVSLFQACPLCRGDLFGYSVGGPARAYMNGKKRSCSTESCGFVGEYSELRRHARTDHPSVRPSEVDPARRDEWSRLERERDLEDVLSLVHPDAEDQRSDDDFSTWISSFFASVFHSIEVMLATRLLNTSEGRGPGSPVPPVRGSRRTGGGAGGTRSDADYRLRLGGSRANRLRWRGRENYDAPAARRSYGGPSGSSSSQARGAAPPPRSRRPRWRGNQRFHQQR